MDHIRRAIVISAPILASTALSACGGGAAPDGPADGTQGVQDTGGLAQTQALNTSTGAVSITNGTSGNFPVIKGLFSSTYTLNADTVLTQAVLNHIGNASTSNRLSLSIACPATVNNVPVVAALLLTLDLGSKLPTAATTYALTSASVIGDALVVATQLPSGAAIKRQAFKINGGSIVVQALSSTAKTVTISLSKVTATATGNYNNAATGNINLSTTKNMALNLIFESTSAGLA
jgi:hypothetical protein